MAGWIDRWRAATVAIGAIQDADVRSRTGRVSTRKFFAVVGTGVLSRCTDPAGQDCWLVTARHVFLDPTENWKPSTLGIVFPHTHRRGLKQGVEIPDSTHQGRTALLVSPSGQGRGSRLSSAALDHAATETGRPLLHRLDGHCHDSGPL
jgi:GNAT superfamily N-acetyltransferase